MKSEEWPYVCNLTLEKDNYVSVIILACEVTGFGRSHENLHMRLISLICRRFGHKPVT